MLVKEAKTIAREWVLEEAVKLPGFYGAYIAGSTNWKADDEPLPPESDIDIKVVIDGDERTPSFTKSLYKGVLIEVSYALSKDYQSPEKMLGSYPFAKHFTVPNVIADPTGQLTIIQQSVARDYPRHKWALKRCEDALEWLNISLTWYNSSEPLHERVFSWLYPFGVATHVLVMPDLRYPTVRQMFVASGNVLSKYGYQPLHEEMLTLLGSNSLSRDQVETLLGACAETLDLAKNYVKTEFFGSTNLSDHGRPTVVEGSQAMIDRGFHREAMLWIGWNHAIVQKALYNDAPAEIQEQAAPSFQQFLRALGIQSDDNLQARHEQLKAFVPRLWDVTESILAANPEVID